MHGPVFQWLSTSPHIPIRWDLRLADWSMQHVVDERATAGGLPVVLDWRRNSRLPRWQGVSTPARVVAVGVDDPRATRSTSHRLVVGCNPDTASIDSATRALSENP